MQHQVTIRLPKDLSQALKAASRRMQRKSSEIVRLALREYLGTSSGSKTRPADRVRGLIGSLESGVPDLAEKHRAYIIESLPSPAARGILRAPQRGSGAGAEPTRPARSASSER